MLMGQEGLTVYRRVAVSYVDRARQSYVYCRRVQRDLGRRRYNNAIGI